MSTAATTVGTATGASVGIERRTAGMDTQAALPNSTTSSRTSTPDMAGTLAMAGTSAMAVTGIRCPVV